MAEDKNKSAKFVTFFFFNCKDLRRFVRSRRGNERGEFRWNRRLLDDRESELRNDEKRIDLNCSATVNVFA